MMHARMSRAMVPPLLVFLLSVTVSTGSLAMKLKTRITWPPQYQEVKVGETAVFRCDVTTDPSQQLSVKWFFNDEPVDFGADPRLVLERDNSFTITRTVKTDSGVYACVAITAVDSDRASATLVVLDVPEPPEIESVSCDGLSAQVKWTSRDDDRSTTPVLFFSVQYTTNHKRGSWDYVATHIPASDREWRVSLRPRTIYKFRVLAHNKVGSSPPSEPSRVRCGTNTDVPGKNPERVTARWDDSGDLVVSWKPMPPEEHYGPDFAYMVLYHADFPSAMSWSGTLVTDWTENKLALKGLRKDFTYRIRVEAHNVHGKARVAAKDLLVSPADKGQRTKTKLYSIVDMVTFVLAVMPEFVAGMWRQT